MNNITPKFNPFWTAKVWFPKKVPSDTISLNHKAIDEITVNKAIKKNIWLLLKRCIDNAPFTVKLNKDILVYKGHGEGDTKWKGWSWKLLLVKVVIYINKKIYSFMHLFKSP
uniref:Uncharacterized protein n=1 Tax=Trichoderma gamsii TaxID=398673 RepID=A0A172M4J6_9HYPO|nr:hypothetical protein A8V03_gp13 [Trichoderma gamsii]ANC73534.1 hypothetical protein Triga.p.15 [Trichoderma gamsii]